MIGEVSKNYPSKLEMTRAKDMLYGISLLTSYKSRANIITLSLHYSFINPRFVDASIDEYNAFIKESLYNSIIDSNTLDEDNRTIKAATLRKIDKPAAKANERFIEIVSKDNPSFSIYSENKQFIKNIDKITLQDLREDEKKNEFIYNGGIIEFVKKLNSFSMPVSIRYFPFFCNKILLEFLSKSDYPIYYDL